MGRRARSPPPRAPPSGGMPSDQERVRSPSCVEGHVGGAGQYRVRGRSRLESRAVCCVLARVPPVEAFQLCSRPAGGVYGVVVLLCGCA
eukprot:scaffold242842_cov30-Tisochrysis_lutea.AAC.2